MTVDELKVGMEVRLLPQDEVVSNNGAMVFCRAIGRVVEITDSFVVVMSPFEAGRPEPWQATVRHIALGEIGLLQPVLKPVPAAPSVRKPTKPASPPAPKKQPAKVAAVPPTKPRRPTRRPKTPGQ